MAVMRWTWLIWAVSSFAQCYYKPYTLRSHRLTETCYKDNNVHLYHFTVSFASSYIIPLYQVESVEHDVCRWNLYAVEPHQFILSATVTSGISACDMVLVKKAKDIDTIDYCETLLTSTIASERVEVSANYSSSMSKDRSLINHRMVLYATPFYNGTLCSEQDVQQFGSEFGMCCYKIVDSYKSIDEGSFLCAKENRCINKRHICDLVWNCADQSDESIILCWPVWAWVYIGVGSLVVIAFFIRVVVWCCSDSRTKKKKDRPTGGKK